MIKRCLLHVLFSLAVCGIAQAADLPRAAPGPVFFTAAERVAIEARRRALLAGESQSTTVAAVTDAAPVAIRQRRLEGVMRRSDGRNVAWFDGEPVIDRDRWQGYLVRVEATRVVLVGSSGRRITMTVGQAVELGSGRVHDLASLDVSRRSPGGRS